MAKLAAYAQYQASQQNQAKSKAGRWSKSRIHISSSLFSYPPALHCFLFMSVVPAESFDWGRYICSNNTTGAPVSCFKHVSITEVDSLAATYLLLSWMKNFTASCALQAPMGMCWGDIEEGVRIEVPNSDTSLSTKVYWIAEIIKLAGKTTSIDN